MNLPQIRYRIRIGGLPWLTKTALGALKSFLPRGAKAESAPFTTGSIKSCAPRILHIHSGWAIETVGRLWFGKQNVANVTFMSAGDPRLGGEFHRDYDFIWYGYSSLYHRHPCPMDKAILAVHDPAELFAEKTDWKKERIADGHLKLLRSASAVVVISKEMKGILADYGITATQLPTASEIPLRDTAGIPAVEPPALLAVGRIYRRKNFEQFQRIARAARRLGMRTYLKGDHFPLSDSDYIAMLDRHPIYVCTSFQEGGPLPVMDAMRRGAVPISTRVGQAPEIIRHGTDGFLCDDDASFLEAIETLARDPARLHTMRLAAWERIQSARSDEVVSTAVQAFLHGLFQSSHGLDKTAPSPQAKST